jgi:hypothetical protein
MAILSIDHLVIAVPDPDAAAVGLEQELGLAFTGGGRHPTAGTWNRLAFLGDAYVELIGVYDRELALANPDFPVGWAALALLDAGREGLATWAVAVDDCAASVVRLRSEGSPIGDPVPGSRVRPDGVIIRWVTAFPRLGPEEPPFLIEHEMSGPEWGAEAIAARRAYRHPGLGKARLGRLVLPVADPEAYADRCEKAIGVRFRADLSGRTGVLGFDTVHLHPTATGVPMIQIDTLATGVKRRSLVRHGVDWFVSPG